MSSTLAVAAGDRAAEALVGGRQGEVRDGRVSLVRAGPVAVVWPTSGPWIDVCDDGDRLVLVDGHIHDLPAGRSPAAAVAVAHRALGSGFAAGLAGDFVAIVLVRSMRSLSVALDPLGTRPWYLADAGAGQLGSADVAGLLQLPGVDHEVDEDHAVEYLAGITATVGRTFHRGIALLPPGTTWTWQDGRADLSRHHRWNLSVDRTTTWAEAVDRCRGELDAAVARRLAVTGPATSEVSGGLDSSAVVGTAVGLGAPDLLLGRLVFDTPRADERVWSDAVARRWQVPLVSTPAWTPSTEEATELTRQLGRPLPDAHFLMFASLRRELAGLGRPDVLTGLGGDDAFVTAGMGEVVLSAAQLRQWRLLGRVARATARAPRSAWQTLHRPTLHLLARRPDRLPGWVRREVAVRVGLEDRSRHRPPSITGVAAIDDRISNLSEGYDAAVLAEQAVVSDLVGARASHPYLDPRFIEATYGLDPSWPTRGDHDRALQVAAYADRLPEVVARRRSKADFSEVFWPQVLGPDVLDSVRSGPLVEVGWLDGAGFEALVADATRGTARSAIPLGRCISLDRWLRSR